MTATEFIGDATRHPQLRIGVLTASLRHAKACMDTAVAMIELGLTPSARHVLALQSAHIAAMLAAIEKADGE